MSKSPKTTARSQNEMLLHQYLQAYIKSQACPEQSTNTESHNNIHPKKSSIYILPHYLQVRQGAGTQKIRQTNPHTSALTESNSDKPQPRWALPTPRPLTPSLVQLKLLNQDINYQQRCEGRHQRSSMYSQNLFTSKAMTSQVRAATRCI